MYRLETSENLVYKYRVEFRSKLFLSIASFPPKSSGFHAFVKWLLCFYSLARGNTYGCQIDLIQCSRYQSRTQCLQVRPSSLHRGLVHRISLQACAAFDMV
jgi:hypothetical protein